MERFFTHKKFSLLRCKTLMFDINVTRHFINFDSIKQYFLRIVENATLEIR